MTLVEGKTYRFKQLCELRKAHMINPVGLMDYLAGTTIKALCVSGNSFHIARDCDRTWIIYSDMLEEVCEELVQEKVCPYIVVHPIVIGGRKTTVHQTKHFTEDEALEKIAECIEDGAKGTYRMYQLYQEVETPKLDISGMIRKIVDKILPKDN